MKNKRWQYLTQLKSLSVLSTMTLLTACGGDSAPKAPEPNVAVKESCLNTSDWSFSGEGMVRSTVAVDQSNVYFGDSQGNAFSLNKQTGKKVWQKSFDGALDSKFVLHQDMLLVVSDAGQLIALNRSDGSVRWQAEIGEMQRSEYDYVISSPRVLDERAYIGTESGELVGVQLATGEIDWRVQLSSPAHSQPLAIEDKICVSSTTDISCVDVNSKEVLWTNALDWPNSPATDGSSIVVGSRWDYGIYSFSLETGEQNWKQTIVDWAPSEPIIADDRVYIGSSDNHAFWALDLESGERIWRADTVANVFSKAVIADNKVIFSSGYAYNTPGFGVVKALDFDGNTLWSLPGCNFFSSPIVDGSSLYIGSDDGFLYSINLSN